MANEYDNVFRNLKTVRRSDFGNVYDPYEKVNIWKYIKVMVLAVLLVGFTLAVAFIFFG